MSVYSNLTSSTPAQTSAYVSALLDLLGDKDPVTVMRQTPTVIEHLLTAVPRKMTTIPEAAGKWSIRDVIQHLADSELVGGFRLRLVLAQERPPLTGYDQDLWADRLRYRDVAVHDALQQFEVLRRANLRLWENLTDEDLARVGLHSERGEESLGHLRSLYAAHDLLHVRQLQRVRAALLPEAV
jgi:hypothetical protein